MDHQEPIISQQSIVDRQSVIDQDVVMHHEPDMMDQQRLTADSSNNNIFSPTHFSSPNVSQVGRADVTSTITSDFLDRMDIDIRQDMASPAFVSSHCTRDPIMPGALLLHHQYDGPFHPDPLQHQQPPDTQARLEAELQSRAALEQEQEATCARAVLEAERQQRAQKLDEARRLQQAQAEEEEEVPPQQSQQMQMAEDGREAVLARETTADSVPKTGLDETRASQGEVGRTEMLASSVLKVASRGRSSSRFATQRPASSDLAKASPPPSPSRPPDVYKPCQPSEAARPPQPLKAPKTPRPPEPPTMAQVRASLVSPIPTTPSSRGTMPRASSNPKTPCCPPKPSTSTIAHAGANPATPIPTSFTEIHDANKAKQPKDSDPSAVSALRAFPAFSDSSVSNSRSNELAVLHDATAQNNSKTPTPPMTPSAMHGEEEEEDMRMPMVAETSTSTVSYRSMTSSRANNARATASRPPSEADIESFLQHAFRTRGLTMQLWKIEARNLDVGIYEANNAVADGAKSLIMTDTAASSEFKALKHHHRLALEAMVQTKDGINKWLGKELRWATQSDGLSVTARLLG
ncbi:hypothetical protein EDB81DRAFT_769001 [Dactylonectria macrodidyma]|uniref:Uncharacterized protein n=1 Tax=Dactylonectria macrodidyma TaxID=307937 RepID=A0A9P9I7J9_9HYPO|nr:hypothetical protein EDB81DRAFT_769001 [Dactylonectria macrodidyma]